MSVNMLRRRYFNCFIITLRGILKSLVGLNVLNTGRRLRVVQRGRFTAYVRALLSFAEFSLYGLGDVPILELPESARAEMGGVID